MKTFLYILLLLAIFITETQVAATKHNKHGIPRKYNRVFNPFHRYRGQESSLPNKRRLRNVKKRRLRSSNLFGCKCGIAQQGADSAKHNLTSPYEMPRLRQAKKHTRIVGGYTPQTRPWMAFAPMSGMTWTFIRPWLPPVLWSALCGAPGMSVRVGGATTY